MQGDIGVVVIILSQSGGEITIELDRVQCSCALGEWPGDGALPRTDLNNDIVIAGRDRSDDRIDNARVGQEMLSEIVCVVDADSLGRQCRGESYGLQQAAIVSLATAGDVERRAVIN